MNIIKKDTTREVALYNKLITELRLNEAGYKDFWSKKENIVSQLKRVLNISENQDIVKELYKVLKMSKMVVSKDKEFVVLKEGEKRQEMRKMVVHNADESESDDAAAAAAAAAAIDDDDDDDDEPDKEDYGEIVNHIAESLPTIIALLAMFSVDTKYNTVCKNVEECLQHSVEKIMDGASRCTCENIDESVDSVNILDCFFNSGKLTESVIREDEQMVADDAEDAEDAEDADEDEEPQNGGAGKPKKLSKIQKQTKRIKQIKDEIKQKTKTQADLAAAEAKLGVMKKNERRKYTQQELKDIMEILLKIITNNKRGDSGAGVSQQRTKLGCIDCRGGQQCARCKAEELEARKVERSALSDSKDDELASTINNIFDTIREAIDNMPKYEKSDSDDSGGAVVKGKKDGKHGLIYGMTAGDIEQKITSYLSVREEEKDKFGEVFTPMKLINEMFAKLPHAVWSDPDKKWLDPANGIGNFPMVAYMRLMDGLKTHPDYSNDQKRSKHIIENMLYMVELNPKNVKISKRIFGSNANICCADFLNETDKVRKEFHGVDNFHVIMGNPPFNASQENEGKKGGGDSLWPKFVELSLDLLVTNGYLMFVHPSAWRKPQSESSKTIGLFGKMAHENHVEYLEIHDTKDGMTTFNVGTRYDWYVIKKHKNKSKTLIRDQQGKTIEINLSEWEFLPNYNFSQIKKIISDTEQDYVIYSRNQFGSDKPWTSDTEKGEFKFPLIHSTPAEQPRKYWSSTKTPPVTNAIPMFDVPKVIFGDSGINKVIIDATGEYGLTQHAIGLKIKSEKEGKLFAQALESSEFKDILNAMSFSNFQIDWRMFKYFRPDFYKQFLGVSQQRTKLGCIDCRGGQQCARCKAEELEAKKEERSASSDSKTKKKKSSPKAKKGGSRRTRRRTNKKQQTTRKNKFIRWF